MQALEPLISNSSDPVALIDLEGDLLWANESLSTILTTNKASSISEILPSSDWEKILSCIHFKTLQTQVQINENLKVPQTLVCVSLSKGDPDAEVFALLFKSFASEAEEVKQHQEMLLTAAHDLKNPLGAIFGYSDLLLDTPTGDNLSEEQRGIIYRVRATADRAINLLRNYQYLSDRRLHSLSKSKSQVDLCAIARLILDSVRHEVKDSPAIEIDIPQKSCFVNAGRTEVERVISNLVSNAVKYTPASGVIKVSVVEDKELPCFIVHNSDSTIPQNEIPLLFDKFSRVSTSAGKPGTGLGLYIVKRILKALGGSINLISDETGTTVSAYFPRANLN